MSNQQDLSEVCHLMAVLFYDPQDFLSGEDAVVWSAYQDIVAAVEPGLGELYTALQRAATSVDLTKLRVDYAALFVGPAELRACPYGSVYLEKGYQLYGETTREVAEFYAQAGLQLGADSATVPDHIAVELEFLHFVLHQMAVGETSPPAHLYSHFLERCFLPFARQLADLLTRRAETDFYRLLGRMLQRLAMVLAGTVDSPPADAGSGS